jgi:iron complex outermembrane recepter protein
MKMNMKKLSFAVLQALSTGVFVSLASTAAEAQTTQKVEKIEVTGSNIKRIEGETAVPITIITKEDIEKTGVTTTAQLLDKLQVNSGAVYNIAQGVGDSGQPGFSGASLRGLGTSNTLILLNGRRIANHAFNGAAVDVNSIPLAAVERVEILKDGASAIYGTDAIGGVINFILKSDFQGAEVSYYKTKTDRGGGDTEKYTITGGYGDLGKQRFNVLVSFDHEKNEPLPAAKRAFAATAIRPDLGIQQTSGNTIPAAIRFDANGNLGNANPLSGSGCAPQVGSYYLPAVSTAQCRYDFTSVLDIFPPVERDSLVAKGAFQLNASTQLFAEYVFVKNKVKFASSETPVNDFTGNGAFIYPAGGRYYPAPFRTGDGTLITPTGDLGIAWRAKDGGRRTNQGTTEASRFVGGVKGSLAKWDYEAAFSNSESKATDTYVDGWFSERRLRDAIGTGVINIWSITGQDAAGMTALQNAKILEDVRRSKGTTTAFDAKASSEIMQMAAGPLGLAVGVESRKEKLDDQPQPVLFSGDILGGGGALPAVTADRRVTAVFAELNVPIIKTLEAQLALRSDRYSDFGSSTNPKVGLRWTPTKELLVRSSYNTGFRAPSLPDMFLPRFLSNTADTHNDPIRCPGGTAIGAFVDDGLECEAQFQNQLGGNTALKPEKSRQATLGIVFEPAQGTSLGFDMFWIKRSNSIQALGDGTVFDTYGAADPLNAQGYFVRNARLANGTCVGDSAASPTPANVPCSINYVVQVTSNLGVYTISGVDVNGAVAFNTGAGKFRLSMDGTYIQKYKFQTEKDGPYQNNLGNFTSTNGAMTRWRHVLAMNWSSGAWGATLSQNFVKGYRDDGGARDVGNVETWDLQGNWTGIKNLQVVLGVRNIMDRDPPASAQGQTFQVGYDPRYGDPFGRTFYGKITYSFK